MLEQTFAMIKPNAVKAGLVGEILRRYETSRFRLLALKAVTPTRAKIEGFYAEHKDRPFFGGLVDFMTSGPILVLALEGEDAVAGVRALNGATDPAKAAPGSIRHAFAPSITQNVVHSSDSIESANREIAYWFEESEKLAYAMKPAVAPET